MKDIQHKRSRLLEYLRCFFWTPTDQTRYVTVFSLSTSSGMIQVRERQRLHFGRWGRFKWRRELRFVDLPNPPEVLH